MSETDDLHALIHSLDQGEKRYFKVRATQHTIGDKNNSVRLFDALLAQADYEEDKLLRQFAGEGLARNLASEKTYLGKLILRAMRGYHAERSADNQLRNLLMDLRFLKGKRLYRPFRKAARKAKKLALKFERFPALLEILLEEREFIKEMEDKGLAREIRMLHQTATESLGHLQELWQYVEVYDRNFLRIRQSYRLRGQDIASELQQLSLESVFLEKNPPHSFHARLYQHSLHAFYQQMSGDMALSLQSHIALLAEWESRPHEIADDPFSYLKSISNLLTACHLQNNYAAMPSLLDKVRALQPKSAKGHLEHFVCLHHFSLIHAFNTASFADLPSLGASLEGGLHTYQSQLSQSRKLNFRYNLFVLHFIQAEYSAALRWINEIVHDQDSVHRQDIQSAARIFLLLLHHELGNVDLLEYLIRSVSRYLGNRDDLHAFEAGILKWLRKVSNRKVQESMADYFGELQQVLDDVRADPAERNAAGLEEVRHWLQAKLQGRSMLEVLAAEAKA